MATVSTYLNFNRTTEAAFKFYETVFGTQITGISRMRDIPTSEGHQIPEADQDLIMNVQLPILGGHILMGTDSTGQMGPLEVGNNVSIMLSPDTHEELDRLFAALAEGGEVSVEPQTMFWGDYYASCVDRFGIHWMLNVAA